MMGTAHCYLNREDAGDRAFRIPRVSLCIQVGIGAMILDTTRNPLEILWDKTRICKRSTLPST